MSYSNPPSTALHDGTLNLPILKFSYTTTSADRTAPLAWTHLSGGSDLSVSFSAIRVRDETSKWTRESKLLKVLKGREVLEELDLGFLAKRGASISAGDAKAPVALVVKAPCLAIRYPSIANQTRRFQVKFASTADYNQAIAVLKEAKCPITEPPPSAIQMSPYTTPALRPGYAGTDPRNVPPTPESIITSSCYYTDGLSTRPASSAFAETRPSSMESSMTLPNLPMARSGSVMAQSHCPKPPQTNAQAEAEAEAEAQVQVESAPRPSTAPTFLTSESISQLLPPKRDLPFAKAKKRLAERSPSGVPSPKKAGRVGQGRSGQHNACTAAAENVARTAHTSMAGPSVQQASHSLMRGKEGEKEGESGRDAPRPLLPSPSSSPQKGGGKHGVRKDTTDGAAVGEKDIGCPKSTGLLPFTREDLSSYASRPNAERSDLIESWVCQQLQNDSFITLCQDMEGVWKRLAFGF
ncbi:hypothetical protein TMEN_3325 [Trichophyton mentagrophytes]|nr:hypothetical protein GY631_5223 [Trichophyton interdigitale]KAG5218809.1 hypothetical protein GY632_5177 [Trichophyton interdigitale]KAG8207205.1 hypothetical protein GTR04_5406 [Trichophyton interdigitale]GBF60867.1 hypothetical protein TMEN_3325 [Trichophyton mentagrophytes]